MQDFIDAFLKCVIALSGLGLAGLLVVRVTPRGRWKIIGFDGGPLFAPEHNSKGRLLAGAFIVFVLLAFLRAAATSMGMF